MRTPESAGGSAVAYVISEYPIVSHTFIQREIDSVRRSGIDVSTVTILPAPGEQIVSESAATASKTTHTLRPVAAGLLLRAILGPLMVHPRAFVGALASAFCHSAPGVRNHLWQVFYFVEALLLRDFCLRKDIRHLHAHHANVSSELVWIAADFGNRVEGGWSWSFTMHGCTEFYDLTHYRLAQKVVAADLVIAVSDYTRSQLLRIVDEAHWPKVKVVHCGVDIDRFTLPASKPAADRLRILFVGRLVVEKGLPVLLDSIAILGQRGLAVTVTIIGDGPLREGLERRVRVEGLPVVFTGSIGEDRIVDHYQDHDIFVMTSFGEGLPVVLMEALACGLPVVAPGITGIPELIEHRWTGLLTIPGRSEELADAIIELSEAPELARLMGSNGRQLVIESFNSQVEGERLATHFRDLIGVTSERLR